MGILFTLMVLTKGNFVHSNEKLVDMYIFFVCLIMQKVYVNMSYLNLKNANECIRGTL